MNSFFASRRLLHEPAVCCSVSSSVPWFGVAQGSLPFVATKASPRRSSSCKSLDQGSKFFRRWRLDGFFRVPISPGSSSLWMPYYGLYSRGICWIDLLEDDCSRWNERLGFPVCLDRLCVPVVFPSFFLGGLMHRQLSLSFTNVCGKSTWYRVCRSRYPSFFAGSFLQSGILGFSPVFPFLLQSSFIMGQAFSVTRPFAVMEKGEKLHSTCGDESDNLENEKDVGGEKQQKRDASEAEHVNKDGTEHGTQEDDSKKISETLNNNVGLEELQHDAAPLGEHEPPTAFSAKVDAEDMRGGDLEEESAPKVARQQVQEKAKAVEDELGPPPERPLPDVHLCFSTACRLPPPRLQAHGLPFLRNVAETQDVDYIYDGVPRFWADYNTLIYTNCWDLMKSVVGHGSSSMLFVMKVMVQHFVSESHKVSEDLEISSAQG